MNDYFNITASRGDGESFTYDIELNPGADVYRGHFPGNPVSPGVCSLRMIADCACQATGKRLRIKDVSRCRFLKVIAPARNHSLSIEIRFCAPQGSQYGLSAKIYDDRDVYVDFRGSMAEGK